jgi:hypothetical protein
MSIPEIKEELKAAFRDFATDGVPASGVHEPVKSEIRAALTGLADEAVAQLNLVDEAIAAGIADVEGATGAAFYADAAAGIAGTADGEFFKVIEDGRIVTYANESEVAVEKAVAPKYDDLAAVQEVFDPNDYDPRYHDGAVVDPATRKLVMGVEVSTGKLVGAGFDRQFAYQTSFPNVLHIVRHSQSNGLGYAVHTHVTTLDTGRGSLKFARGVGTYLRSSDKGNPTNRLASAFEFVTLLPDPIGSNVGTNLNGLADGLKDEITGQFSVSDQAVAWPRILVTNAGEGSRYLSEIGPDDVSSPGGQFETQMDDAVRGKASSEARGWSYGVGALIFTQGENEESGNKLTPAGSTLGNTALRDGYLASLMEYFDAAEAGYVSSGAVTRALPCFIEQIGLMSNSGIPRIATAHLMCANQRANTFLIGPMYQYPSAMLELAAGLYWGNSPHFSGDGARWKDEKAAQAVAHVLMRREAWRPVQFIRDEEVSSTVRRLHFHVPKPPLVLDTDFLGKVRGYGVLVYPGDLDAPGTAVVPTSVEIVAPTILEITLPSPVTGGFVCLGDQTADIGAVLTVASVGTVAGAAADGSDNYTVTITGDQTGILGPFASEGLFYARGAGGAADMAIGPIRSVAEVGGNTVLTGEVRDRTAGTGYRAFVAGDTLTFLAYLPRTNIRDSDQHLSSTTFTNPNTNTAARLGKAYPMWNWACLSAGPVPL